MIVVFQSVNVLVYEFFCVDLESFLSYVGKHTQLEMYQSQEIISKKANLSQHRNIF